MHNKVVTTTAKACDALNMHTIRFNFRGVGDSAGEFDNGVGECDDLRAVQQWAQLNLPDQPIIFAGFSFGSYVSARTASSEAPTALITIAPAVSNQDYAQHPEYSGPWQVILADQDTITPIEAAQTWLATQPHQPHVHIIEGACHFFHGKLDILEQTIQQFLKKGLSSMSEKRRLKIATRPSTLAQIQAQSVMQAITTQYPDISCEIVTIQTAADKDQTTAIDEFGGKGIFVKAIDDAILEGRADIAVHSVKDMSCQTPTPLCLTAVLARAPVHDVLISHNHINLQDLPKQAVIGTSSTRRACQLQTLRPDLSIRPIRGNVDTRIGKIGQDYDAIILAYAGLTRLKRTTQISTHFSIEEMVPAPAQGAIGMVCLESAHDIQALLRPLNHTASYQCVQIERHIMQQLGSQCFFPVGIHAHISQQQIQIYAFIGDTQHMQHIRIQKQGPLEKAGTYNKQQSMSLSRKVLYHLFNPTQVMQHAKLFSWRNSRSTYGDKPDCYGQHFLDASSYKNTLPTSRYTRRDSTGIRACIPCMDRCEHPHLSAITTHKMDS